MRVEFYVDGSGKFIAAVDDGQAPTAGNIINIRKKTYVVSNVSWAIDNSEDVINTKQRCCVELSGQP